MSLILDALNRADKERSVEQSTPNLQSSHIESNSSNNHIRRWILEAIIIGSVLLVALYFYTRDDNQADNSTSPAKTIIETSKTVTIKTPSTPVETTPTQPPINKKIEKQLTPSDNSAINALYQQPKNESSIEDKKTKAVKPEVSKPTIDNTESILSSIPLLAEQSRIFQRQIPSIEYSFHAYAEQGGLVILNGNKCRVGTVLPSGVRIIAILENSLVLEYNSRQFRLLALNSWVNL
jgi:hypothetical protein